MLHIYHGFVLQMCILNHQTFLYVLFRLYCLSLEWNTAMRFLTYVRHVMKMRTVELCSFPATVIDCNLLFCFRSVKQEFEEYNDLYCLHLTKT